jgi:hypothetical protein
MHPPVLRWRYIRRERSGRERGTEEIEGEKKRQRRGRKR